MTLACESQEQKNHWKKIIKQAIQQCLEQRKRWIDAQNSNLFFKVTRGRERERIFFSAGMGKIELETWKFKTQIRGCCYFFLQFFFR